MNKKCLELAEHFVNVRGCDPDFYKKEKANYKQFDHLRFSFWYAVTSIKRRIPSRGEEFLNGYHSLQGKKFIANARMNK